MVYLFCPDMLSGLYSWVCVEAFFFIFIGLKESFAEVWTIIIGFVCAHKKTPASCCWPARVWRRKESLLSDIRVKSDNYGFSLDLCIGLDITPAAGDDKGFS